MPRSVVSVETGCKSARLSADGIQVSAKGGVVRIPWRDVQAAALAGRDRREMPKPAEIIEQMKAAQAQMEAAGMTAELMDKMQKSTVLDRDALLKIVRNSMAAEWLGEKIDGQGNRNAMQLSPGMIEKMQQAQARMESAGIAADSMSRFKSQMEAAGVSVDELLAKMELQSTHDALWIVRRHEINCVLIEESGPERDALLAGLRSNLGRRWLGEDFTWQQLDKRFCRWGVKRTFRTLRTLVVLLSALVLFIIVSTLVLYALPIATGQLVGLFLEELLAGEWKAALIVAAVFAVCLLLCFAVDKKMRGWRTR